MKNILIILTLLSFFTNFSQNSISYFPQEQVILEDTENIANANQHFYQHIEKKIKLFLDKPKLNKELKKIKNDTLKIRVTYVFNKKMEVDTDKSRFSLGNKKLNTSFLKKMKVELSDLTISNIINRKSNTSKHFLQFNYKLERDDDLLKLILLESKETYSGGVIEEAPIFPSCEGLDDKNARICFQFKMQEHIKNNFKYPKKAQQEKIAGKVYIIFTISKSGNIENIRTRGPHKLLEEDAIRIIKLLPKMTPGKRNGKPTKVPFSIPITYKLN